MKRYILRRVRWVHGVEFYPEWWTGYDWSSQTPWPWGRNSVIPDSCYFMIKDFAVKVAKALMEVDRVVGLGAKLDVVEIEWTDLPQEGEIPILGYLPEKIPAVLYPDTLVDVWTQNSVERTHDRI